MTLQAGSVAELEAFQRIQQRLPGVYDRVFGDDARARTVVVVPSLSLDPDQLSRISGVHHYEERMLCLLMLLRMPRTSLVYVTSERLHPTIVDYYLHLLPGVPSSHAQRRLTLIDCGDSSARPLTEKILSRPDVIARIDRAIADPESAHMTCFNVSSLERSLSVQLDIPIYGCDPSLQHLGNKSHGRRLMREAGVNVPPGFEHLSDWPQVVDALVELRALHPDVGRAVVKLNDGFSGEGNAVVPFPELAEASTERWRQEVLPASLEFAAPGQTLEEFALKLEEMGGVVEAFVDGSPKASPSVQCRIDPHGELTVISSHDQVLGGTNDQIFKGCRFPASDAYRLEIQQAAVRAGEALAERGVIGRFSIDFLSVQTREGWEHYGLEVNLRKGGTTLPNLMLEFLTDGAYDPSRGVYETAGGGERYYYASDNVEDPGYVGMTPDDLVDIAVSNGVHFDATRQTGVVFHLMGALEAFGKLGLVSIGLTPEDALRQHGATVAVLDQAAGSLSPRKAHSRPRVASP